MKRIISLLLAVVTAGFCCFSLAGCDVLLESGLGSGDESIKIDNSVDLKEYTPTEEDGETSEGEQYYTSRSVSLVTEVWGNYSINRPFTLDPENEGLRVYSGIYFYPDDYFQILYYKNGGPISSIFASLSDESDGQYAEVEYSTGGDPLQINIVREGIYDLILNTDDLSIDMVRVGDIDTPVYEMARTCEMKIQVATDSYEYKPMQLDKESGEYYLETLIPQNAIFGFYSESRVSNYKVVVGEELADRLVYQSNALLTSLYAHVGGRYRVYFNARTYELRMELVDPARSEYFLQIGFGEGNVLAPDSADTPYLFTYELNLDGERGSLVRLPKFYPELGMPYSLTLIDPDDVVWGGDEVADAHSYLITVNLLDFTMTVEEILE